MRKSSADLAAVQNFLKGERPVSHPTLRSDLVEAMRSCLSESNARSFNYMIAYYGLASGTGMTLESIGTKIADGLTRERVRQIIDTGLHPLLKQETQPDFPHKPYKEAAKKFEEILQGQSGDFIRMEDYLKNKYLEPFAENKKGLIAFLNDAGIRQVVYRGERYLYADRLSRRQAIESIQAENKKTRRSKTLEKMDQMAKTVTYVPVETREFLLEHANKEGLALNRLYEKILHDFMSEEPCKHAQEFPKTQSWRARQGKAEWNQVGIYIDRMVFERVKDRAGKVVPNGVSNMSYICQAFVWFAVSNGKKSHNAGGKAKATASKSEGQSASATKAKAGAKPTGKPVAQAKPAAKKPVSQPQKAAESKKG